MRRLLLCTALATTLLLPLAASAQDGRKAIYIGPPGHGHLHSDKQTGTLNSLPQDAMPRLQDDNAPKPSLADRPVGRPGPEKEAPVYLEKLAADNSVLMDARVELLGAPEGSDNSWSLTIIERPLFLSQLLGLKQVDKLPPMVSDPETGYSGIRVTLVNHDGTQYAPIYVLRDQVRMFGTHPLLRDSGRNVEYWLASTAKTVGQFNMVSQLMPPASYEECQTMGFQILYSTPRQCVLADGTTFIEGARRRNSNEPPVTTFEACAADPQNRIVETFPRKCIAPGGRLLIEPPPPLDLAPQEDPQPVEPPPAEQPLEEDATLPPEDVPLPPADDAFIPPQPEPAPMNLDDIVIQ